MEAVPREDTQTSMDGVEARLVRRLLEVSRAEISKEAVEAIHDSMVDTIACAIAAVDEPVLQALARTERPVGAASVWLPGAMPSTSSEAALVNGTAAHALDFDDYSSLGHPSSHLVPAILAMSHEVHVDGDLLVSAYATGFEAEHILDGLLADHYASGWHPTATLGVIGSAAAAAVVLGLGVNAFLNALGIATSMSSGARVQFGSMTKPLHSGLAASGGIRAALLARAGVNASADVLSGASGFLDMFASAAAFDEALFCGSAAIEHPGALSIKCFPTCASTHAAIVASLRLRDQLGGEDAIDSVRVATDPLSVALLKHTEPETPLEAKFSMQHGVAAALLHGEVGLEDLDPRAPRNRDLAQLRKRIDVVPDSGIVRLSAEVILRLASGQELGDQRTAQEASPGDPHSRRRVVEEKLRAIVDTAGAAGRELSSVLHDPQLPTDLRAVSELVSDTMSELEGEGS